MLEQYGLIEQRGN